MYISSNNDWQSDSRVNLEKKRLLLKISLFILTISFVGGYILFSSDRNIPRQIQSVLGAATQQLNLPSTSQSTLEKYKDWKKYELELPNKSKIELLYPKTWNLSEISNDNDVNVTISSPSKSQFRYIFSENESLEQTCPDQAIVIIEGLNNNYIRYIDGSYYTNENWYICESSSTKDKYILNFSNYFSFYDSNESDLKTLDLILASVKRSSI